MERVVVRQRATGRSLGPPTEGGHRCVSHARFRRRPQGLAGHRLAHRRHLGGRSFHWPVPPLYRPRRSAERRAGRVHCDCAKRLRFGSSRRSRPGCGRARAVPAPAVAGLHSPLPRSPHRRHRRGRHLQRVRPRLPAADPRPVQHRLRRSEQRRRPERHRRPAVRVVRPAGGVQLRPHLQPGAGGRGAGRGPAQDALRPRDRPVRSLLRGAQDRRDHLAPDLRHQHRPERRFPSAGPVRQPAHHAGGRGGGAAGAELQAHPGDARHRARRGARRRLLRSAAETDQHPLPGRRRRRQRDSRGGDPRGAGGQVLHRRGRRAPPLRRRHRRLLRAGAGAPARAGAVRADRDPGDVHGHRRGALVRRPPGTTGLAEGRRPHRVPAHHGVRRGLHRHLHRPLLAAPGGAGSFQTHLRAARRGQRPARAGSAAAPRGAAVVRCASRACGSATATVATRPCSTVSI